MEAVRKRHVRAVFMVARTSDKDDVQENAARGEAGHLYVFLDTQNVVVKSSFRPKFVGSIPSVGHDTSSQRDIDYVITNCETEEMKE